MGGIYKSDDWFFGRGTANDEFLLIRARRSLPAVVDRELFGTMVAVIWNFDRSLNNGMPSSDLMNSMEDFESAVLDACDKDGWWGCGVGVITTPGRREWRFYTPNPQEFSTEFNRALTGQGPYPIQLSAYADPEWIGLSELL